MKLHVVLFFLTTFCLLLVAPAVANDIYDNGGTTGTADAWTVNFQLAVSDSFVVGSGVSADEVSFHLLAHPRPIRRSAACRW